MTKITYTIEQQGTNTDAVKPQQTMLNMLYAEIKHLHELNGTIPTKLFQAYNMINLLDIGGWKRTIGGDK